MRTIKDRKKIEKKKSTTAECQTKPPTTARKRLRKKYEWKDTRREGSHPFQPIRITPIQSLIKNKDTRLNLMLDASGEKKKN